MYRSRLGDHPLINVLNLISLFPHIPHLLSDSPLCILPAVVAVPFIAQ